MAKKKVSSQEVTSNSSDAIDKALRTKYGDNIFVPGEVLAARKRPIISVSPTMDLMLGGGIQLGSLVIVTGKKKLGKTTMCLHVAAKAQKLGCKVYFFNIEGRLEPRDLAGIPNLELGADKFEIIESKTGQILHAEDFLDILNSYAEGKTNSVFIADSLSQLCSKERRANKVGDRFRDDVPLMVADMTKRCANVLPVNNNILMGITHITANQGGGPALWSEQSGEKIQYQSSFKLKAEYAETHIVKDQQLGQLVHWKCEWSSLGPPGRKTSSLLRYGEGIDEYYDLMVMCLDLGILGGSTWIEFPDGTKAQGKENARNKIKADPALFAQLSQSLKDTLG